jgi:hypothetical protein
VYEWAGVRHEITGLKLVIGGVIVVFAIMELMPHFARASVDRKYLWIGGMLSGFFGGLSGHQGALRSLFLLRSGLEKEAFIATNVTIAVCVDVIRLAVYGAAAVLVSGAIEGRGSILVIVAVITAFLGSWLGRRFLVKTTLQHVHVVTGVMLLLFGLAMGLGLI